LFDLEQGEHGVFASALNRAAHGYGEDDTHAVESLLDAMVDTAESLEKTPSAELDPSAVRLRDLIRKQLSRRP
jgi:hypothetical protein